jgi:integrase
MQDLPESSPRSFSREPWNKGKLTGAKPPLRQKHVWAIRSKLQVEGRTRDLAMFNLAIDSKLRGWDLVSLRVEDIAPHGRGLDRATVRQKKTGRPVRFEITEQTREAIDAYIKLTRKDLGDFLFGGRRDRGMTTRQYARLVASWVASIGLDPSCLALTRYAVPRQALSTAALAISGPYSCSWVTAKSRARFGTLESRSTMRSP